MLARWAQSKRASIAIIAFCQVAAMALWFSASAVIPALVAEYRLSEFAQAALTSGVQAGFVLGCLASAMLGLADRLDPRRFFAVSAAAGALANALLLVIEPTSLAAPALRVVTGACMAGVYPVGMKLASTWAKDDMGLMVGILVGALTLGSAAPHLFNAIGGVDWRIPLTLASASATVAAALIGCAGIGPNRTRAPRFDPRYVLTAWRDVPLRLANLGYLGHMWELYAMWALLAVCVVWGVSIVADSAQFSASIAELSDPGYVGTMLTLQTALGFTLTLVTIHLMPHWVATMGWRHAFVPLAIGPAIGVWAMARLRAHPRSVQLAGGRR